MPQNFGYKHLVGLAWLFSLIAILLVVLLTIKNKYNKDEKYDRAVIKYTCCFMWVWEIIKTIRLVNGDDYGPVGHYPLWMAPFHICSMGLYAYLIIGSKKDLKLREWVMPFGYAVMILVTSIILIIPGSSGILGDQDNWKLVYDNILPYKSFFYHGCLVFVPLYMILSGLYKPRWSDIYKATAVLFACALFAQSLNFIFEGSNCDFMMLRYGNGNPIQPMLNESPVIYYLLMVAVAVGGTAIVIAITILLKKLFDKKNV